MVFTVGQKVSVWGHYERDAPRVIATVTEIGPRKLTLSDKSEWAANGHRTWGSSRERYYTGPYLREYQEGDEEKMRRARLLSFVSRCATWDKLSAEQLAAIAAMIKNPEG